MSSCRRRFGVFLLALLTTQPAMAFDCQTQDRSTREIVLCGEKKYEAAQKRLDDTYAMFNRSIDAYGADLLAKAQALWLQYR